MLLLAGLWPSAAEPYVQSTYMGTPLAWAEREVTLNLVLPCLSDACYEAVAIEAAQAWTDAGARFTFHTTTQLADPCDLYDGLNTASFVNPRCDMMPFPPSVVATTLRRFRLPTGELVEADVIFDSGVDWGIYEGPYRGTVVDFYRLALHEFGHVFGSDHPDEHGQVVQAIMNSRVVVERLQADDIAGIRAIYGRTVAAAPKGSLENPGNRSFKSGIGVISAGCVTRRGWKWRWGKPASPLCMARPEATRRLSVGIPITDLPPWSTGISSGMGCIPCAWSLTELR